MSVFVAEPIACCVRPTGHTDCLRPDGVCRGISLETDEKNLKRGRRRNGASRSCSNGDVLDLYHEGRPRAVDRRATGGRQETVIEARPGRVDMIREMGLISAESWLEACRGDRASHCCGLRSSDEVAITPRRYGWCWTISTLTSRCTTLSKPSAADRQAPGFSRQSWLASQPGLNRRKRRWYPNMSMRLSLS